MRALSILILSCCILSLYAAGPAVISPDPQLALSPDLLNPEILLTRDWQINLSTTFAWANTWNPNFRNLYSYRYDGQMDEMLTQNHSSGSWQDSAKQVYAYDAQARNSTITNYTMEGANWALSGKTEKSWSADLLMIQDSFLRQNNSWQLSGRMSYSYTLDRISAVENYQMVDGSLILTLHNDYEYDDQLRLSTVYIRYIAYPQISDTRMLYSYNDEDMVSEILYQQELQAGLWTDYFRYSYSYEDAGEISQILIQNYGGSWSNFARQLYSYPQAYAIKEMIYQTWDNGSWVNQSKTVDERNPVSNSEELSPSPGSRLSLYPNPLRNGIWIEDKSADAPQHGLEIYNLKGQRIRSFAQGSSKIFWDAKDKLNREVPAGIYILKEGKRTYRLLKL